MSLFTQDIKNWDDWFHVFQSVSAFTPLVEFILSRHGLEISPLEKLAPGTNAVFRVGEYVVKIFSPQGLCNDYGTTIEVEMFGMRLAEEVGVPAPRLIADGEVDDKYFFRYMVMDYIHGKMLCDVAKNLSYDDKVKIGQNMRKITDALNQPCENFSPFDVKEYALASEDWREEENFPEAFLAERLAYLDDFHIAENEKVYCHGDFHAENVLVDDGLNVYVVDFADAMHAPVGYEQVYVVSALFCFERPYMEGYFGEYDVDEIVDLCMTWLPVHAWGHGTTAENLKPASEITSFEIMRKRLRELVEKEKGATR
ncbi:MAG: aminoglycoside phosphotransferase family protein [Defluviitaleaceae bacterium]|nr:aminoglycoside phosphotransferase family protein [Defluviitaleaceae bacterium]